MRASVCWLLSIHLGRWLVGGRYTRFTRRMQAAMMASVDGPISGKLLVASPGLDDPNFRRTVVLVIEHDAEGAFGVVLNRPASAAPVRELVPSFATIAAEPRVVFMGGPVEPRTALALGRFPENAMPDAPSILPGVRLVALDGSPPASTDVVRVFSGYAGWGAGQLDEELHQSAWFVVDPRPSDVFTASPHSLWREVLRRQQGALAMFALYPDTPGLN